MTYWCPSIILKIGHEHLESAINTSKLPPKLSGSRTCRTCMSPTYFISRIRHQHVRVDSTDTNPPAYLFHMIDKARTKRAPTLDGTTVYRFKVNEMLIKSAISLQISDSNVTEREFVWGRIGNKTVDASLANPVVAKLIKTVKLPPK